MIAKLKGRIEDLRPTEALVDVAGVVYLCHIPLSTFDAIRDLREVSLFVHTYHKEDQLRLFGFSTPAEKSMFLILLGITGIGPSMALSILSGISIEELLGVIRGNTPSVLTRIPGIGKAKADKLIFELSRKIKKIEQLVSDDSRKVPHRSDAVDALVSLGFDEGKAAAVIDEVLGGGTCDSLEMLVKKALQRLSA